MLEELKKAVCSANLDLAGHGLVIFSWGNVSGIDREKQIVAIKPSGIDYNSLEPKDIVLVDMDGEVVEGELKPSSDTPTHLEIYKKFDKVGGVCHTHSTYATMWAQACKDIPCFGTTHADYFYGSVPVTAEMKPGQIQSDYEHNTGVVIVEAFSDIDPMEVPAVLVANHGPFSWGENPDMAVESAVVLENTAKMAIGTLMVNPEQPSISNVLLDKHYLRKHGKNAYYGQK